MGEEPASPPSMAVATLPVRMCYLRLGRWRCQVNGRPNGSASHGLEPLHFLPVRLDPTPHEEGGGRQQGRCSDQDGFPNLLLVADHKSTYRANHHRPHGAEEGEHEQVERGHLAAHLVWCDSLDR